MSLFTFILILVFMVVVIEAGTKLLLPVSRRLADLMGAIAEEKRQTGRLGDQKVLPEAAMEEIEERLTQLDERLAFLEELRAPASRPELHPGEEEEVLGSRRQ